MRTESVSTSLAEEQYCSWKKYRRFIMSNPYDGQSTNVSVPGVSGENTAGGHGVRGTAVISSGVGVLGENTSGDNVHGTAVGVQGSSNVGIGMVGFGPIGVKGAGPI